MHLVLKAQPEDSQGEFIEFKVNKALLSGNILVLYYTISLFCFLCFLSSIYYYLILETLGARSEF
jgi:hypothetical protein